ncbi:hypothetical protein [Rhodanobacter lindaniclasticus]
MLYLARGLADGPLILTAALLGTMLMFPRWSMRSIALKAVAVAAATLLANLVIGTVWDRARLRGRCRPSMGFPCGDRQLSSDHLTVQWVVAGMLLLDRRSRVWGIWIALLGLPMAWARISWACTTPAICWEPS